MLCLCSSERSPTKERGYIAIEELFLSELQCLRRNLTLAQLIDRLSDYHVSSGYFTVRDMKSGEVITVQGTPLTAAVSSSDVRVNGARVTKADIAATNGIVHAIDAVILPKNRQLLATAA